MISSWDRIRTWLASHAPDVLAQIQPPATEADLTAASDLVNGPLPEDLLEWWRLANGMADAWPHPGHLLPPWFDPYPVAKAMQRYEMWIDVWHNQPVLPERQLMAWARGPLPTVAEQVDSLMAEPAGTPCEGMYLPVWLPIAGSGMGLDLFVDLRPGPLHGCVMRFDRVGTAQSEPDWPSVAAMLAEVADALEHGRTIGGDYPVRAGVDDEGRLVWDPPA